MTALASNLYAHMGCRINIPIYVQNLMSAHSERMEDIRALEWCPGQVAFPMQLYRLTFYKQHQLIIQIWYISHNNFFSLSEVSGMDISEVKRRTIQGEAFGHYQRQSGTI